MSLPWQEEYKIVQLEKALKQALFSEPDVQDALVRHIRSLNLPGQVKAKMITPDEAAQAFYKEGKIVVDTLLDYTNKKAMLFAQLHKPQPSLKPEIKPQPEKQPNKDDYTIPVNVTLAREMPDSLTSESAAAIALLAHVGIADEIPEMAIELADEFTERAQINEAMTAEKMQTTESEAETSQTTQTESAESEAENTQSMQAQPTEHLSRDEEDAAILTGLKAIDEDDETGFAMSVAKMFGDKPKEIKEISKETKDVEEGAKETDQTAQQVLRPAPPKYTPPKEE